MNIEKTVTPYSKSFYAFVADPSVYRVQRASFIVVIFLVLDGEHGGTGFYSEPYSLLSLPG